jgi:hypothetical protein
MIKEHITSGHANIRRMTHGTKVPYVLLFPILSLAILIPFSIRCVIEFIFSCQPLMSSVILCFILSCRLRLLSPIRCVIFFRM